VIDSKKPEFGVSDIVSETGNCHVMVKTRAVGQDGILHAGW
jgi:hypothetical protein